MGPPLIFFVLPFTFLLPALRMSSFGVCLRVCVLRRWGIGIVCKINVIRINYEFTCEESVYEVWWV